MNKYFTFYYKFNLKCFNIHFQVINIYNIYNIYNKYFIYIYIYMCVCVCVCVVCDSYSNMLD